ncbi:MAG: hypothetical protein KGD58_11665 [Candidatus Lokiarchaeota archaeon]|nr:hypothetical protein [Candidatus Lokiarchaeota archaeon]
MINIKDKDKEKTEKEEHSAEEVAKAMIENMIANMKNPNFLDEKEERLQKAANEVIKKRKERERSA